ncbi:MAG: alpha/beta fold hydrolase, partial [Aquincola sp.]|nr:alpha/beta fold hydrolase [Aquincola sp.]
MLGPEVRPIAVLAIVSDLIESVIKRRADTKDTGQTIPGIGGMFDLSDSLILTAPVGFIRNKLRPGSLGTIRRPPDCRVIAPDYLGMGLSDKPPDERLYTLENHTRIVTEFVRALGLRNVVLAVQDWGGPIGLGYALANREDLRQAAVEALSRIDRNAGPRQERHLVA